MTIVREESKHDPRLRWFDEARFGMFVHFGLYALLGRSEWVMYNENIPRAEYGKLAAQFNPHRFRADDWIDVAEQAGCRYITVTSKHHDGFCLWDSALTDYKITHTPFGRDLLGELIAACQRRGLRIILYYSQPDWHHPSFVHLPGAFKDLQYPRPGDHPDWPAYQAYLEGQVRELVTNYGRIDGIWFDGTHKSEKLWRGQQLYEIIKQHQPHAVVNDRGRYGDYYTPERELPEDLTGYLFEACESVTSAGWGWAPASPLYSVPHLLDGLVRMAGAGGNYLLNVGPRPDGTIAPEQAQRLAGIGDWLRANGAAIYATEACRLKGLDDSLRATRKGNDVYVLMRRWPPQDRCSIEGLHTLPESAQLLSGRSSLQATLTAQGLELRGLPMAPPDANPQVIRLAFATSPSLDLVQPGVRSPALIPVHSEGATLLRADDAIAEGRGVKGARIKIVGGATARWIAPEQSLAWAIQVAAPGRYRVRVRFRCARLYAGSTFELSIGDQRLAGTVRGYGPGKRFYWQPVGELSLPAGAHRVSLAPIDMPYGYIFADVRAVELAPR